MRQATETFIANGGQYAAYGGGGIAAFFGYFSSYDLATFFGALIGLTGIAVQVFFNWLRRRDERESKAVDKHYQEADERRKRAEEERRQEIHDLQVKRLKQRLPRE